MPTQGRPGRRGGPGGSGRCPQIKTPARSPWVGRPGGLSNRADGQTGAVTSHVRPQAALAALTGTSEIVFRTCEAIW